MAIPEPLKVRPNISSELYMTQPPQLPHSHLHNITGELAVSVCVINSSGSLEHLDNGLVSVDFKDLALAQLAVSETQIHNLGETRSLATSRSLPLLVP